MDGTFLVAGLLCWMLAGFGLCLGGLVWLWRWSMTFEEKVDALATGLEELRAQAQQNTADVAALQAEALAQGEAIKEVKARADDFDGKLNLLVDRLAAVLNAPAQSNAAFGMTRGGTRVSARRRKV